VRFGIPKYRRKPKMRHVLKIGRLSLAALLTAGVAAMAQAQKPAESKPADPAPPAAAKAQAATPNKAAVGSPKIDVVQETRDMGTVPKGQVIETDFVIKNTGGSDLIITDARPSCGCTVSNFDKLIKPGGEGKVHTSVDTKSFSGPISKSVLVVSNDPDRPQMNLFVKAVVKPFVDVAPQQYVRFSVVKGDTASQDVVLISEEKGFKPTVAETAQPYVKAEISPTGDKDKIAGRPGEQYKLNVSVLADAPEGLLNAPVRINTGVQQQPSLEIPVSGIVRPRVSVSPITVNFGNFTAGKDPITRNIVVTNNKPGTPVKVTKAEVSVPGFMTDVVPTQEGVSYTVVVKASDKVKSGDVDGKVTLHTTDKDKGVIEIPLKGKAL
jgi:Protein of unknown function (DUF1573)